MHLKYAKLANASLAHITWDKKQRPARMQILNNDETRDAVPTGYIFVWSEGCLVLERIIYLFEEMLKIKTVAKIIEAISDRRAHSVGAEARNGTQKLG